MSELNAVFEKTNDFYDFCSRVICERGIDLRRDELNTEWHLYNGQDYIPIGELREFRFRPILAKLYQPPERSATPPNLPLVLPSDGGPSPCYVVHSFPDSLSKFGRFAYSVGALLHHIRNLALLYVDCAQNFAHFYSHGITGSVAGFGPQPALYYEFDALLFSLRRSIDAARFLILEKFEHKGSTPSNFENTINTEEIPTELRNSLEDFWNKIGSKIAAYRDCCTHNTPFVGWTPRVLMEQIQPDFWTVKAPIPDNPEAKSPARFQFTQDLDALTYGWEAATEWLRLCQEIAET